MSVGANIKKRRFELRMSQQDLADAMGYRTRSTIAKIESGENDVSQKKLQRFAVVLDTTVEALTLGTSVSVAAPVYPVSSAKRNKNGIQTNSLSVAVRCFMGLFTSACMGKACALLAARFCRYFTIWRQRIKRTAVAYRLLL